MNKTNEDFKKEKDAPFLQHLEELRKRLIYSGIAVLIATAICFFYSDKILYILVYPVHNLIENLIFINPTEAFMAHLKSAFIAGILLSLPFTVYQLWKFVNPGLYQEERNVLKGATFWTVFLFLIGILFAYFLVVPIGIRFLLKFQEGSIPLQAQITLSSYLSFLIKLVTAFGLVFELPVVIYFLARLGIIDEKFLKRKRRLSIVFIFIISAILTPPDVFSQALLAMPLLLLYEFSIYVAKIAFKKSTRYKLIDVE